MRCWYTRWQMSNALDRGELAPVLARGHAARCAACQAFGHALVALDDRLSRAADTAPPPPPPAVRRARSPWWIAGPLAAGSAAVIAIVVATGGPSGTPAAPVPSVQVSEALGQIRGLADRVSNAVTTTRTPLEIELDNLIRDGKRGLAAVLETGGLADAP
jgi:hypothetical protein